MKQLIYPITAVFLFQTMFSTMALADTQAVAKAAAQTAAPAKEPSNQPPAAADVPEADQIGMEAFQKGINPEISKARYAEIMKLRETKPFSSLFVPESACVGQEKLLDGFINEVATTDGNGNETANRYRGKLTEKENELGDRNFDFDKLQDARFNAQNDGLTNLCLDTFADLSMSEWTNYFNIKTEKFECGLVLKPKADNSGFEVIDEPGARKDTCDIPYGNQKLYDFYKAQMEKLKEIQNSYRKKSEDERNKAEKASADKAKTQATVCTDPAGCPGEGAKNIKEAAKGFEKYSKEWCCQRLGERFELLGFTTMKDAKPNERVCNELLDKETDGGYCDGSFCVKTIGDCLKNFASVFLRDFFSSLVSSFDILGWGSQLMTMVKEIVSNPYEAGKNIVENMFGFDSDYMGCLNKKSQSQYVCQMIGKFAGSSAGFSAGLGAIIGLARGVKRGVVAKMSKTDGAKIIKPALLEAGRSGKRAAAVGIIWPYYATRGVVKGSWGIVKGAWKKTPVLVSRAANTTVSLVPEATGRLLQGGKVFFKGEGEAAIKAKALIDEAAATRLNSAKEFRSRGKQSPETAAMDTIRTKYKAEVGQVEAAVKVIDDELAALQIRREKIRNGKIWKDGAPAFGKNTKAASEYKSVNEKIDELNKAKESEGAKFKDIENRLDSELGELKTIQTQRSNSRNKNIKGLMWGVGATGSQYPVNKNLEEKKEEKTAAPKPGDPTVAPPVQGVGTGDGLAAPPATAAPPAVAPAAVPKVEEKKPAKPPVAPPAASGKSEKESPEAEGDSPPAPPGP